MFKGSPQMSQIKESKELGMCLIGYSRKSKDVKIRCHDVQGRVPKGSQGFPSTCRKKRQLELKAARCRYVGIVGIVDVSKAWRCMEQRWAKHCLKPLPCCKHNSRWNMHSMCHSSALLLAQSMRQFEQDCCQWDTSGTIVHGPVFQ